MGSPAASFSAVLIFGAGCLAHSFHAWWNSPPAVAASSSGTELLGERCLARLDALGAQVSVRAALLAAALALGLGAALGSALTQRLTARVGATPASAHASVSIATVVAPSATPSAAPVDETFGDLDLASYVPRRRTQ